MRSRSKPLTRPTAVDVFAGCGGLTKGLRQAGFRVVGAIEINKTATAAYLLNNPDVHVWSVDVATVKAKDVLKSLGIRKGDLDLLAGCPPCQGFSSLRTLNGNRSITDDRNDLIFEYLRLIRQLRPKTVMLENVPGLSQDSRLTKFVKALKKMKFHVTIDVLDAADYAVPQRRRRLILLASRLGAIQFARPARKRRTVREAIGDMKTPGRSGDKLHDLPEQRAQHVQRLIAKIPKDGGSRMELPKKHQLECHQRCNGFKDVYGRMAWSSVAPTITTGCFNPSKGRFLHPEENRNITMREAAILQTFPRRYRFPIEIGKQRIAEMIGNALPPEFIRRHARMIYTHLTSGE